MITLTEELQDNFTLEQKGKYGGIVVKQWPKFDSNPGKHENDERYVLEKSPDGTCITCQICF